RIRHGSCERASSARSIPARNDRDAEAARRRLRIQRKGRSCIHGAGCRVRNRKRRGPQFHSGIQNSKVVPAALIRKMSVETAQIWLTQYQRALRFVLPYWKRLAGVTLIGLLATAIGLAQPYFSKLLIVSALLRRDMRALVWVAGLMAGFTIAGFVLNIISSYQYVRISAQLLFEIRLPGYWRFTRGFTRFLGGVGVR